MSNEAISQEAKLFIFGLEQCRGIGGMVWHGEIPKEIAELFGIDLQELVKGYHIAGVYVTVKPQYEAYSPNFVETNFVKVDKKQ